MSPESPLRDGHGAGFELIETLRWEPQAGFIRLDRHLAKLATSARELGFRFSNADIRAALDASATGNAPLRVRLTLAEDGRTDVTTQPFSPLASGTIWTLAIAKTRLDANDPLLRHKTTRRAAYDTARAEFSREMAGEVILLNQQGNVCEGTITNIFIDAGTGPYLTPALQCGLLPGVLRAELLATGQAIEAKLAVSDLQKARAIFVGNSLRGLIPASLIQR